MKKCDVCGKDFELKDGKETECEMCDQELIICNECIDNTGTICGDCNETCVDCVDCGVRMSEDSARLIDCGPDGPMDYLCDECWDKRSECTECSSFIAWWDGDSNFYCDTCEKGPFCEDCFDEETDMCKACMKKI